MLLVAVVAIKVYSSECFIKRQTKNTTYISKTIKNNQKQSKTTFSVVVQTAILWKRPYDTFIH